jgi:hypothetical protein
VENDNTIGQDVKTEVTNEEGVKDTSVDNDNTKTENNIPYARFKDVNDKLKTALNKIESFEANQEKTRMKKMEEDGKLKELLAEKDKQIESMTPQVEELVGLKAQRRESLISKLPEDMKEDEDILAMSNTQIEKVLTKMESVKPASVDTSTPSRGMAHVDTNIKNLSTDEMRSNWSDILKKHSN